MPLLLFDIDGTLVTVDGAGSSALKRALSTLTKRSISVEGVSFSGRTDPAIMRDVLAQNGVSPSDGLLDTALTAYAEAAQETIRANHVRPLPGVESLLSRLSQYQDMHLGLVTGNIEPVAYHKLHAAGFSNYFLVGAFGSDSAERADLPPLAAHRAHKAFGGSFSKGNTVVIGDTPQDIQCARSAGFRAVAVCTGRPNRPALATCDPDLLLENLQNGSSLLDFVRGAPRQS